MTLILAFGNKARHGKDTAGEAVQKWCRDRNRLLTKHLDPYGTEKIETKKVNFADALRKEVTQATFEAGSTEKLIEKMGCPAWVTPDPNPPADPLLPHGKHAKLLQWWGTEYRRNQDRDYWVNKWKEQVLGFRGIVVTCDMRFVNEADAVKSVGGNTINVTRLKRDGSLYVDPSRPADHPSEIELDNYNFDFYIKVVDGHIALVEQFAVTLVEYLKSF